MSIISITLRAVDQYSGTLTGLNQGFELVGKAISAMKSVADAAFSSLKAGIDLAAEGGSYNEIQRQFNNVAKSFEVDGRAILDDLNAITLNMLDLPSAARLAGRGVSAGLTQEEISTAFEFIKRRTELTGEDFEGMSTQVFRALSSGRTSVLRQMGLVIESGADMQQAIAAMRVETEKYGEAGFNAADRLATLNAQQGNFLITIGSAINETPIFQAALNALTDTVIFLVRSFDPRPLTVFFDVIGTLFFDLVGYIANTIFPGFSAFFGGVVGLLDRSESITGTFVQVISGYLFSIVRTTGKVLNDILDILDDTGILTFIQFSISAAIDAFVFGANIIAGIIGTLGGTIIEGFSEIIGAIGDIATDFPKIAELLGVDPKSLRETEAGFKKAAGGLRDLDKSIVESTKSAGEFTKELGIGLADSLRTARIDLDAIDQAESDMQNRIGEIDFSKTWQEALSADVPDVDVSGVEVPKLSAEIEAKLDTSKIQQEFDLRAREIELAKLDQDRVGEQWASVNWPSELENLGLFIFNWALAKAADEDVPLAVVTG